MKICPTCGRAFASDVDYCLDDGTRLGLEPRSAIDTPTQILTTPAAAAQAPASKKPVLYVLIGAMAATIAALGIVLYYWNSSSARSTGAVDSQRANTSNASATNTGSAPATKPAISEDAARQLMDQWRSAQNSKDFYRYKSLYSPELIAIKETATGPPHQMNYAEWMADRRKDVKNFLEVEVLEPQYNLEGDHVVVKFRQRWRSLNYCDIGQKIITVKMFADGPKITSETIIDPVRC